MKFSKPAIAGAMVVAVALILAIVGIVKLATPDEPTTAAPAAPAPTVTVTATPAPAPTQTVEVPVTPRECREFIDDADALVKLESEVIDLAADAIEAVYVGDEVAIEKINDKMDRIAPKLKKARDAYTDSRDACGSAA